MIPISPPKLLVSKSSVSPSIVNSKDEALERNILSMASMDLPTAIQSMNAIENVCIKFFDVFIRVLYIENNILYVKFTRRETIFQVINI